MSKTPRGHTAKRVREAAVSELSPLLSSFIADPFDPLAICNWYLAFAKYCPLWPLQRRAYGRPTGAGSNPLRVNHAWAVMCRASNDSLREPHFFAETWDLDFAVIDVRE